MSHPILYDKHATQFFNLGLGVLKDAVSCLVTEERNGVFELEMSYPSSGALADLIEVDYLIKADAGHRRASKEQVFRIERIDKGINGAMTVYAKHVSYLAQSLALRPSVRINGETGSSALGLWRDAIVGAHPFRVSSDISRRGSTHLTIQNCQNARQALGGANGSILDVWGGEYLFDNYHVQLFDKRGRDANTLISYGRNLVDLDQEENIANTFTSIYPYAIYGSGDDAQIITLASPNFVMDSENARYFAHRRVLPVDFSREFERDERPTAARLRELGEAYMEEHEIGVPRVSISLSFVDLTKALNGAGLTYEELNLCDTVPVYFEKLGIKTYAQVVRVEWNVLLDQYENIEVGHTKKTLGDTIRGIERDLNQAANTSNSALTAANGKNTVFFGHFPNPPGPTATRVGDLWYRPNGEHTELWTWNGSGWEFVMSTAPDEALLEKIAEARREAERALQEAEDAMTEARDVREIAQEAFDKAEPLVGITNELTGQMTTVTALAQGLQTSVSDLGANTQSQITQLSNQIHTEVTDLRSETQSSITQLSNNINLQVEDLGNNVINRINVSSEGILINGNRIHITGQTFIDNAVITNALVRDLRATNVNTDTLVAGIAEVIELDAGSITTGILYGREIEGCAITGGSIEGTTFRTRSSSDYSLEISNGEIEITDEEDALAGRLRQSGLQFFSNRGDENHVGSVSRIRARQDASQVLGVRLSSRIGYSAGISRVDGDGIHHSRILVRNRGGTWDSPVEITYPQFTTAVRGRTNNNASFNFSSQVGAGGSFYIGQNSSGQQRIWSDMIFSRTTSSAANVHINGDSTLIRSTSASKYKLNMTKVDTSDLAEKILNLDVTKWFDKPGVEAYAKMLTKRFNGEEIDFEDIPHLREHYGLIAEDVSEAGLDMYVSRGSDGEIEGIEYDRLWTLLIPLVKDQKEKIESLENQLQSEISQLKKELEAVKNGN